METHYYESGEFVVKNRKYIIKETDLLWLLVGSVWFVLFGLMFDKKGTT